MNAIGLISSHLDESLLQIPIVDCNCVCSFTGQKISRGVRNTDLIKKTFTDQAYLRYPSDFSSVQAALCIESVIPAEKGPNALRNYSYIANPENLYILKREDILQHIISPPEPPFVFCVTYSNKKHTAYKAALNWSKTKYVITTDIGDVEISAAAVSEVLPVIQSWYTIIPGKETTTAAPTFFTKAEILSGCNNQQRIRQYGITRYFQENQRLEKYRSAALLKLLTHTLNKTQHVES